MATTSSNNATRDNVADYYGKTLTSNENLATNVVALSKAAVPQYVRDVLKTVHKEVTDRFYGCGVIAPECIAGKRIVDLGSGSGQDCFVLSKLVGEEGEVVGVDMTDTQLEVARKYIEYHRELFGFKDTNVTFKRGFLENLTEAGLQQEYFDVAVANCVINLTKDKKKVFSEAHNVLKVGGELHFSDTFTNTQLSDELQANEMLWGECISGALYWPEFLQTMHDLGYSRPYLINAGTVCITQQHLKQLIGDKAQFVSAKYRVFKLPSDKASWHPGGFLTYLGGIPNADDVIQWGLHTKFLKDVSVLCDSELVTCIMTSRFCSYFRYESCDEDVLPQKDAVDIFEFCQKTGSKSACCR